MQARNLAASVESISEFTMASAKKKDAPKNVQNAIGRFICTCSVCVHQVRPFGSVIKKTGKLPYKVKEGVLVDNERDEISEQVKGCLAIKDRTKYFKRYGGY